MAIGEEDDVVGVCVVTNAFLLALGPGCWDAAYAVASAAGLKPAVQGFHKKKEEVGREAITLDGASCDVDVFGLTEGGADACFGTLVEALHYLDGVWRDAQFSHDVEESVMIDAIECRCKVH